MSLEKKAENLLEAVTALVSAVTSTIASACPGATAPADTGKDMTKKDLADLKKAVKAKGGEVLKKLGKEALAGLFQSFGAANLAKLKPEVFSGFMVKADELLTKGAPGGTDDDDLLGLDPPDTDKVYTLEDVQKTLLKINNTKALGRDVTRQILADFGAPRLGALKKENFGEAMESALKALKDAEVK